MKRKNTNKTKFGRDRKVTKDNKLDLSSRGFRKEHENSRTVKVIFLAACAILCAIPLFIYLSKKDKYEEIREAKQQEWAQERKVEERGIELGKLYMAAKKTEKEGDAAFDDERYFEAVFRYQQAVGYDENNLALHEKLLEALKRSCDNGNEDHCRLQAVTMANIINIQNDSSLQSLRDKRDSMLLQIGGRK
ncbi:MAG: hypothetical protein AAFV95_06915 [Bacteroidota bacterium]